MKFIFTPDHYTPLQAMAMAIFTYALFAISDSSAKWLQAEGYAPALVLVLSALPGFIVLSALRIRRNGLRNAYKTRWLRLHAIRATAFIGLTFCLFRAVERLPLADFYSVVFTSPFLVTIGAFLLFRERVSAIDWAAIAAGFCGVLIIVRPESGGLAGFNIGYLYAFGLAACISIAALTVRKIGRGEDPLLFVVFANMAIFAAYGLPALWSLDRLPVFEWIHAGVFAVYSVCIPGAILLMSATFARAQSVMHITPFQYTQIVWGALIGWLAFGDIPSWNVVAGACIVVGTGLFVLFHKTKGKRA